MFIVLSGIIAGLLIGLLSGLSGMGGGSVIVPVIVHIFGLGIKEAIGTSLVMIVLTSLACLHNYLGAKLVNIKLALLVLPFGIAGAQAGVFFASLLSDNAVKYIFVFVITSLGLKMLFHTERKSSDVGEVSYNRFYAVLIGFSTGIFSGLCGVGGAVLIIPLFYIFLKIPMHTCIGTVIFIKFFNALSGGAGYMLRGLVDFKIAGILAVSSMIAAPLGARISINMSRERLRKTFSIILILSGLSILL